MEVPEKPNITGLILARGGSKEIPLKNLATVGNIPLLARAIHAMKEFGKFDSIWVSTDHEDIASCSRHHGAQVFMRNPKNAKDYSKSIDAVQEFLKFHKEVDILCLVQCTSPFIQPKYLRKGYKLMTKKGFDSVFSGMRDKKFRWKVVDVEAGGCTQPINLTSNHRKRRQDMQGEIVENGMFYFTKRDLLEQGVFQGGRIGYVEIPAEDSIEIDSKLDLLIAQAIHQHSSTL